MQKHGKTKPLRPKQQQRERPGRENRMKPRPKADTPEYRAAGKL
jgi:hypothetical protein